LHKKKLQLLCLVTCKQQSYFKSYKIAISQQKWRCLPNISTAGAAAVEEYASFYSFDCGFTGLYIHLLLYKNEMAK